MITLFTYDINRRAAYFGRTTPRVEWVVIRSDGRQMGTYATRREAQAEKELNELLDRREAGEEA
jgi:hypothetical protein